MKKVAQFLFYNEAVDWLSGAFIVQLDTGTVLLKLVVKLIDVVAHRH